jgi:hypothetical protein
MFALGAIREDKQKQKRELLCNGFYLHHDTLTTSDRYLHLRFALCF